MSRDPILDFEKILMQIINSLKYMKTLFLIFNVSLGYSSYIYREYSSLEFLRMSSLKSFSPFLALQSSAPLFSVLLKQKFLVIKIVKGEEKIIINGFTI